MSLEGWKTIFEIGGAILLFLTFVFGTGALWTSRRINEIQAEQLRTFDKDLTEAKTELGKQQERAAKAEQVVEGFRSSIAQAEQRAAEANTKAEGFRLDIAKANERAAEANQTAEHERLARIQLEARLADRTITPQQQNAIRTQLSAVTGIPIDVVVWGDNAEIQTIFLLIVQSIPQPAWTVHTGQAGGGGAAVRGILIGTKTGSSANIVRAADLLVSALQSVGLAAGAWAFDELRMPGAMFNTNIDMSALAPIRIFIGSK